MRAPQFLAAVCLLAGTGLLLSVRGDKDKIPVSTPLSELPQNIAGWSGTEIPLDQEVLDVLGKGSFLNRVYQPTSAGLGDSHDAPVQLFIGYFPTQRTGQAIHSPQHCLPGAGWTFETSGRTNLAPAAANPVMVGDYVIRNGSTKAEVLYWYRSHGRTIASDYAAKLYTFYDSMRYGRTDAALIRVLTPIRQDESIADAHKRLVNFADKLNPILPPYIPD